MSRDSRLTVPLGDALANAVLLGDEIPAHDATFDLAADISERLGAFHAYIAQVRDQDQANAALVEFADAIKDAVAAAVSA